ncbi:autotransporter outer membrane beta-barrel domain-containing protein [Pseudomonas veronii]
MQAGDDGGRDSQVELKGGKIQTSGSDAYGLHSLGGNISGFAEIITEGANGFGAFAESDSSIDLHDSAITTSGTTAHGLLANNDAGTDGGRITTNKVAIKTLGDGSVGAFASGGGSLDLTDTTIRTEGLRGYGAYATADSSITLKGGAIITANETGRGTQNGDGSRAYALYAEGDGANISADDLSIKTLGQRAYGAYAIGGGDITLANTNVTTEGFMAYGLYASGVGSTLTASNTNVTTTGQAGDAVWAYNNGVVNLNGGTFHVLGEQNPKTPNETANGLVAVGSGSILATDITLVTEGANSAGLLVGGDVGADKTAGTINLKNSSVTVKGADAFGAIVSYGSSLNLEGSQLISNKGAGIQLNDNASVNLNGSRIVAAKETFVSNLSNTFILPIGRIPASPVSQTINVGAGSVATQNNGTLLRVNREDGAGGDVTLNLGAGSVTSGDILDTDDHNIGGTDVTLEAGAFWTGIMQGVRNFFSEQKSDVVFQDRAVIVGDLGGKGSTYSFSQAGGSIGGNVDLSGGSSTTGGSIGTPVIVAGDVAIDQTSLFGGNWDIDGDVTNSGTIRPGNSVGVINIGGDLTLAPTSVYAVEVDANGSSDRVNVTGIARLDGSVAVSSLGTPLLGTPYTVLTAGGGFAGTQFDSVALSNNYAFITPALSYDANQVLLSIDRNNVTYASVAQTKNQAATAAALDQLPLSSAVANTLAFTTTAQARGAFNQLSGEIHASAKSALIEDSRPVRDAVDNRIRATFEQPADSAKGLWIQAYGARSDIDGNSNVADLHHSTGGVLIGADGFVTETVHVGLVTGYGHSSFDANDRDSSGSSDNYHFGLYGGSEWGNLAFRSGVIYTWHDIETRRSVGFGGLSDRLKGDYDGRSLQAFGELGYKVETAGATYEPFANLTHVNLKTDGFTEKGGATALSASDQTTDTTFTTLGLRADTRLALGNVNAKLRGKLGWQHAFNDRTPVSNNSFVGGNGFNVDGTEIGKDTAIIETGIDLELTSNTALGVSYMGQIGSGTTQQGVNANISVKF